MRAPTAYCVGCRRFVPLGSKARAVLAGLCCQYDNPWVIAGKLPGSHITGLQKPWRRIRARRIRGRANSRPQAFLCIEVY